MVKTLKKPKRGKIQKTTVASNIKKSKSKRVKGREKSGENNQTETTVNIDNKQLALCAYLQTWSTNKAAWKFETNKQTRLVKGMLDSNKVPDDIFPIFVEYMVNANGRAKTGVIDKAKMIVEEMEKWSSLTTEEQEQNEKPDIKEYNRARMIVQTLV